MEVRAGAALLELVMRKRDMGARRESIDVSRDRLNDIILLAHVFDAGTEDKNAQNDSEGSDEASGLGEAGREDDPAAADLYAAIDTLSEDEQAALVALVWIGRGDFEPAEFDEALTLAFDRKTMPTAEYLMGIPMLGELMEQGAAVCGGEVGAIQPPRPESGVGRRPL